MYYGVEVSLTKQYISSSQNSLHKLCKYIICSTLHKVKVPIQVDYPYCSFTDSVLSSPMKFAFYIEIASRSIASASHHRTQAEQYSYVPATTSSTNFPI